MHWHTVHIAAVRSRAKCYTVCMSEYVTKAELKDALKAQTEEITSVLRDFMGDVAGRFDKVDEKFDQIDAKFEQVDARFDTLEQRFDTLEQRFDISEARNNDEFVALNQRIESLEHKFDRLLNTIDGFVARIDRYETEQTARDSQFEKLLIWARKVSEKTGIPLENL